MQLDRRDAEGGKLPRIHKAVSRNCRQRNALINPNSCHHMTRETDSAADALAVIVIDLRRVIHRPIGAYGIGEPRSHSGAERESGAALLRANHSETVEHSIVGCPPLNQRSALTYGAQIACPAMKVPPIRSNPATP